MSDFGEARIRHFALRQMPGKCPRDGVEEWTVVNGGYGRIIVVNAAMRNEADLIQLAEQLKRDTSQDPSAFIVSYDNKRAATLRKATMMTG